MILTGSEIIRCIEEGTIVISDFDKYKVNPNSYNLRLADELIVYDELVLDCRKNNRSTYIKIPDHGYKLEPGTLYLGRTMERTFTPEHVPLIEGRSSLARLGLTVHASAGFGDIGFMGYWTLEISVIHPLIIYPGIEICQIYYHTVKGEITERYEGKYQNNDGIQTSLSYKD